MKIQETRRSSVTYPATEAGIKLAKQAEAAWRDFGLIPRTFITSTTITVDILASSYIEVPDDFVSEDTDMSLDKAIEHNKEHRKPYRGAKAVDPSCRNHGGCKWCEENRTHSDKKREPVEEDWTREEE